MSIEKWDPITVKRAALAELQQNAELVGVFVETEARRRLDAISNPDTKRDRNYRHYLSKYLLTHVITSGNDFIEIDVGMKIGPRGSGASYHGFFIEIGSDSAPAHPYLRPAVFDNRAEILQLLAGK